MLASGCSGSTRNSLAVGKTQELAIGVDAGMECEWMGVSVGGYLALLLATASSMWFVLGHVDAWWLMQSSSCSACFDEAHQLSLCGNTGLSHMHASDGVKSTLMLT
jgi:hypothetical protein